MLKDLIIVQEKGVFYIYVNAEFYCSCDNMAEVREELEKICTDMRGEQDE